MASSSLERTGEQSPVTKKGHDTEALGPSDSSDTGSDIAGAPGLEEDQESLDLQRGTTSDPDRMLRGRRKTAGPDIGDEAAPDVFKDDAARMSKSADAKTPISAGANKTSTRKPRKGPARPRTRRAKH